MMSEAAKMARELRRMGFDKTRLVNGVVSLGCSQCEATGVNSRACHEHGCPNRRNQ